MLSLRDKLARREAAGTLRRLTHGRPAIDFASNDTLGLARSHQLTSLVATAEPRAGSTGSRLLTGNSALAEELENAIAQFHGYASGTLFGCGYLANVGLLSAVTSDGDTIFFDAQVHASMHDGIRLSGARAFAFRHNDMAHLEERLKRTHGSGNRFVCVESIYSTDGSVAHLRDLCQLAARYDAQLIVDEAHAVGVWGPQGKGLVAEHELTDQVFAQVVTFGKALGCYGAVVVGSDLLKQVLVNFANAYVYTTALPETVLAAIRGSYALFPSMERERQQVRALADLFDGSHTHIQPIGVPGAKAARALAQALQNSGFDVRALLSPTVRRGQEVLRLCLHAFNTEAELVALFQAIAFFT